VNNQLNVKRHVGEPLPKTHTESTTKVNNYSEFKVNQLAQLQQQCSKQLQSLKETVVDLALLELQVKKITSTDTILNSCDQCVGKDSNLCERCIVYIGEHMERYPNASDTAKKDQLDITIFDAVFDAIFDEGQEDAYWL
jgi:hypothetical protein|tara:strand:- start:117 stop:533 length:417 start_codon:yes stop_codon:yes gene_type:complete